MPLEVGTRLGHYDVTALIGEGGMGQVYQATDTKLNRQVALKILPEAFATDPDRLARFQREAQVLASLNHPNIAAIYGLEEADDTRALVLELVEGPTLADRIAQGAIPLDEALPIAKQIAEALEAAHEAGVIHRDLKPANIKVKDDGTVKVLDFGLAKAFQPDASDVSASMSPTISLTAAATQMGMVIGTAAYMAPEQARGKQVDKRADIFAFGVVLYEMLAGQRPFQGEDVSLTLAAVMTFEADFDRLPETLSPTLKAYLTRCLAKDPSERVRDIGDVRLAMTGAFETEATAPAETVTTPELQVWQRPLSASLLLLVSTIVIGLGVWALTRPAPPRVVRFPIPLAAGQTFNYLGRPLVAISPDGTQVVYVTGDGLWLRPLDELQAIQLPGTGSGRGVFFSPDGQSVGFWGQGPNQLRRVSLSGGTPVTIADVPNNPSGASWGDDDMILFGQPEGIMRVSGTGGTPALLIQADDGEIFHGPQMLPGDEWVLFTIRVDGGWDEAAVVVESVTTGERTVLIDGGRDGRYLPTGHLVYGLNSVLLAVPFDVNSRQVIGGPVPLVEGVRGATLNSQAGAMQWGLSADGSLVYVPGSAADADEYSLVWVDRAGEETAIRADPRGYVTPRISPDGTRIAVTINDGDNSDVWVFDLARETLTQLTFDAALDEFPQWTPDSTRVVFRSLRDGGGLFWKAADGTGQVERLMESAAALQASSWSTDGRLVFNEEAVGIGVLTVDGDRAVEMLLDSEIPEQNPTVSPDGRWLAYTATERGLPLVYVQPFPNTDDGKWLVSASGEMSFTPVWSPGGLELFYNAFSGFLTVTQIETEPTFSAGTPEPLFSTAGYLTTGGVRQWDIAPDGDRFVFRKPTERVGQTGDDFFNGLIFVENWVQELTERVPSP